MLRRFTIGEVNGVKNNIRKIFIHLKLHTDILHTLEYIMKAKKKPIITKKPADYNVSITPRLKVLTTVEPTKRQKGLIVESVPQLVARLKDKVGLN